MSVAHTIRCLAENSREQSLLKSLLDSFQARSRETWEIIDSGRADVAIVGVENPSSAFLSYAETLANTVVFYTSDSSLVRIKQFVLMKPASPWELSTLLERLESHLATEKRLAAAFVSRTVFDPITVSSTVSLRSILSC